MDVEAEIRDLKRRIGELEDPFAFLTQQVKAIHIDLLQFRAKTNEHFKRIDERFDRIDERFVRIDERFDRIDARFGRVDERFDRIDARFDNLEKNLPEIIASAVGGALRRS